MLVWAAIAAFVEGLPPASGEPVPLRWLRKLGEHGLRTSVGTGLVLSALAPPGRVREHSGSGDPATATPRCESGPR